MTICYYSGLSVKEAKELVKKDLIKKNQADIMYEPSRKAFSRSGGKIIVAVLDGQWFLDFNHPGWKEKAYKALEKMTISPENFRKLFERPPQHHQCNHRKNNIGNPNGKQSGHSAIGGKGGGYPHEEDVRKT